MSTDLERRRALLTASLGFALLDTRGKPAPTEVQTVREWLARPRWWTLLVVLQTVDRATAALVPPARCSEVGRTAT